MTFEGLASVKQVVLQEVYCSKSRECAALGSSECGQGIMRLPYTRHQVFTTANHHSPQHLRGRPPGAHFNRRLQDLHRERAGDNAVIRNDSDARRRCGRGDFRLSPAAAS